ncbi:F0F1 ATP synthase subunit delta [Ancylobacter sp. TS-1]|uniref:F0F1 ATP synthase subunit delta n=1 Tax=Ancylobacter sp. TS-1 TaxID=1850374 RepID=UPI00352F495B
MAPDNPERGTVAETYVSGVAGRYATALFELARDAGAVDAVKADLERFSAMIAESDDLKRLVRSPVFTSDEQEKAIAAILDKAGIGGLAGNFFKTVAANRRLFTVEAIMRGFDALVAAYKGEVVAEVTVAQPLSEAHAATLKEALDALTGKDVKLAVEVDPSLLGGLKVKIGSKLVDASLKTKLNSIRHAMKEVR